MRLEDRESLLWDLSEIENRAPRDDSLVPDATLRAYRRGELGEDETRQVERLLVAYPANRRRLEELAGLAPVAAPAGLRRQVLEAATRGGAEPARRLRRPWPWRLAVAAAAVVVVAVGWLSSRTPPLSVVPAYQVQIAALTDLRDAEPREPASPATAAEAFADSTVTITATAFESAVDGVEIGLYRAVSGRLERVPEGGRVERLERQGAVRIRAPAAELVGSEPGDHEVFVAIAGGRLPAAMAFAPGSDPAATLAAGGRRQVHRLTLRLLAETSAEPVAGESTDEEAAEIP